MFKPQFAPFVESGAKRQTIRPFPARMPSVGDLESWRQWSGKPYRSKQIELARVVIISVSKIVIRGSYDVFLNGTWINGPWLVDKLAMDDGFASHAHMLNWFIENHGLPFVGILIRAGDAKPEVPA